MALEENESVAAITLPDFRLIFESIPGPTLVLLPDDPTFTIIAVSNIYLENTSTTREQLLGHGLFEVLPDLQGDSYAAAVGDLRASLHRVLVSKTRDSMPIQKYQVPRLEPEGASFEERYWSPINSQVIAPPAKLTRPPSIPVLALDLPSVKRIVQRYARRIWVESDLGHGTTFFFTVPEQ